MIRLSIIIPVYNKEQYLMKCLDSVVQQVAKDIEVILVDDGSNDKSGLICDEYAKKYKWIKVIHQKNQGVSGARNRGILEAQGNYIGFVDADDRIDSRMYDKLLNIAENIELDIVFCDILFECNGKKKLDKFGSLQRDLIFSCRELEPENLYELAVSVCRGIYRRKVLVENHIFFQNGIKLSEDKMFLIELLGMAHSGYYLSETLYFYELNKKGAVCKYYPDKLEMQLHNKNLMEGKLKKYWSEKHVEYYYRDYAWNMVEVLKSYFHKECICSCKETYRKVKELVYNPQVEEIFQKVDRKYWLYLLFYKKRVVLLYCMGYAKMKWFF